MRSPFYLRCYAKQTEGQWVAVCIDLSLAAQDDTYDGARAKLKEQVDDYLDEVVNLHLEHARDLLHRPAPIEQRLEYQWIRLKGFLNRPLGEPRTRAPAVREQAFEQLAVHA
jgi:hypothetical protein